MPGTLYVVATPIGNLEDITLRALRILREVDLIAAEDTRRTARLLQQYSISTPTTSLHEHNERERITRLLPLLLEGKSVALVSDAGTPAVSDPGATLVRAARQAGVKVEPIPGASAVLAAVSAAGLPHDSFVFVGFPPSRSGARKTWLRKLAGEPRPIVLYEAPHRIRQSLADMLEILGDRTVLVARELTKMHEELVERPISELLETIAEARGEFTVVIPPHSAEELGHTTDVSARNEGLASQLRLEYAALSAARTAAPRAIARELAERHGLSARHVYDIVHAARPSGNDPEA